MNFWDPSRPRQRGWPNYLDANGQPSALLNGVSLTPNEDGTWRMASLLRTDYNVAQTFKCDITTEELLPCLLLLRDDPEKFFKEKLNYYFELPKFSSPPATKKKLAVSLEDLGL